MKRSNGASDISFYWGRMYHNFKEGGGELINGG